MPERQYSIWILFKPRQPDVIAFYEFNDKEWEKKVEEKSRIKSAAHRIQF